MHTTKQTQKTNIRIKGTLHLNSFNTANQNTVDAFSTGLALKINKPVTHHKGHSYND